ncbi:uncharacterized protein ARMOST_11285 [Armillaria ostoyae]|uniref:DNA 3'-5' helicase n=1 Tax=Armillaria ostoyae TaxID=47428 RepID=A0A284RGQ4_ARMOS|nr:uncharacterized protein ARMOST_11285 [Armillaria ostoyae]
MNYRNPDTDIPYAVNILRNHVPDQDLLGVAEFFLTDADGLLCSLPDVFWTSLTPTQHCIALRASLLSYLVSNGRIIPRQFQLEATIAMMELRDSLIDVGTGYGKTLCMVLPQLLDPEGISINISPLKRLQTVQAADFLTWGIRALCINEDTPDDSKLWNSIRNGDFKFLIVSPEQFQAIEGKYPRLARMLRETKPPPLIQSIKRVFIDEAHNIHTAGLDLHGIPAFRPAYARLGALRIKLSSSVPFQALSGTQPPHIKETIVSSLGLKRSNLFSIKLSSNRSNIIYATRPVTGSRNDFRNLAFLIPVDGSRPTRKALVFHDVADETSLAADYLDSLLSPEHRDHGVVRHYHSGMSLDYLTAVYNDFCDPNGTCKILLATEGASTGLDIHDVFCVILYGLPRELCSTLQRSGRVWRNPSGYGIVLLMYEPWALTADLSDFPLDDGKDPDRPREKLTKYSTKEQRTSVAMLHLIQRAEECIRHFFSHYLADKTDDAVLFTTQWCCDRHSGNGFKITDHFDGRFLLSVDGTLYYESKSGREAIDLPAPKKRKRGPDNRPTKYRNALGEAIHSWRNQTYKDDPQESDVATCAEGIGARKDHCQICRSNQRELSR